MNIGAFGENFPYTNFHDLNLDWIVKIAKDFLDQYTHLQETIEQGLTDIDDKTTQSISDLEDKYDALIALLDEWYETHDEDIANALQDALDDLANALTLAVSSFTTQAEAKAQEVIASIPSDYSTLATTVQQKALIYKGTVSQNDDLDTYVNAGVYYCASNRNLSHTPSGFDATSPAILVVMPNPQTTAGVVQMLYQRDPSVYFRMTGSTGFGNWSKNLQTDSFSYHSTLSSGTDLNSITTEGIHYLSGSNSYTNLPDGYGVTGGGILIVFPSQNNTSVICQMLIQSSPNMFVRTKMSNTWANWSGNLCIIPEFYYKNVLPDNTDLDTILDSGAYYMSGSNTFTNLPDGYGATGSAMLYVFPHPATGGYTQLLIQSVPNTFIRFRVSTTWGNWSKNITKPDTDWNQEITDTADMVSENEIIPEFVQGTWVASRWSPSENANYVRTEPFKARGASRVCFEMDGNLRLYCMVKYKDETNSTDNQYNTDEIGKTTGYFDVPDADEIVLVIRWVETLSAITPSDVANSIKVWFIADEGKRLDYMPRTLMSSFKRFAVYGDSLASGHVYRNPDSTSAGSRIDMKSISWPVMLSRILNNTVYNHSLEGMSCDTFITGIKGGVSTGDNSLACALDGNHDVPLCIIAFGSNNPNDLPEGSIADIDLLNPENDANTIYGNMGKLIQLISNYYYNKTQEVHIAILLYGNIATDQNLRTFRNRWINVINRLKTTVEGQNNHLWAINMYDIRRYDNNQPFFTQSVIQRHWTGTGYNALGELIGMRVAEYMFTHATEFLRIEFATSNEYITSYSNPTNYT